MTGKEYSTARGGSQMPGGPSATNRSFLPRIAVIGAGINGLVAAHYLRRAGCAVTMLERSPRPGGACVYETATVDGQTTAHYITDLLYDAGVTVTRLAHGVPVGGELDYLDEGTLSAASRSRTPL